MSDQIQSTFSAININITDKEFILQHSKRGYRCISWHPHYIMTNWVKDKENAILQGDFAIAEYYDALTNKD